MAKRWTIPFVSRQSKQCRIDIYDPAYSGAATELSTNNANAPGVAAEDPFYFEEDDDEDLLNVVRIKTGYINLIETTFGGLDDIYPTSWNSRYVEVYYDSTLAFRGYIQQQSFENSFGPAPREVSLPVMSILGAIEMFDMDLPSAIPSDDMKLGYYMKQLIDKIDSSEHTGYSRVVFPVTSCPDFIGTIHPYVVNEENSAFNQEYMTTERPYQGISLYDFLEGICNAYEWICHDLPDCILFTKFDHDDKNANSQKYYYYSVSNLATATASNRQELQEDVYAYPLMLDDYVEPCSDDGVISQIMPLHSLSLRFKGDVTTSVKADYKHMECNNVYTYTRNGNEEYVVFLKNVSYNKYPDVTGDHLLDYNTIDQNFWLERDGVCVFDMNNTVRLVMKRIWYWASDGDTLATLYFYKRPILSPYAGHTDMKLKIDVSTSDNIYDFGDNYIRYDITYLLYCGSQLIGYRTVQYRDNNNHMEFSFNNVPNTGTLKLVIRFDGEPDANPYPLLSFDNIELYYKSDTYKKYVFAPNEENLTGTFTGTEDGEVDMLMSCNRVDDNFIGESLTNFFASYDYLRRGSQNRLQIRMRPKSGQSLSMLMAYINRIQYWKTAWRWRLIAMSFNPWDDEYTLTLHHSTLIDPTT